LHLSQGEEVNCSKKLKIDYGKNEGWLKIFAASILRMKMIV
jgi:hypothetical protein